MGIWWQNHSVVPCSRFIKFVCLHLTVITSAHLVAIQKKVKFFSKVKTINETHCHHCKRYLKFKVIFSIHCWIICTMTHHSLGMKFDRVNLIFGQDWFLQRVKMDPFLICTYLVGLKSFSVTIQNGGGGGIGGLSSFDPALCIQSLCTPPPTPPPHICNNS